MISSLRFIRMPVFCLKPLQSLIIISLLVFHWRHCGSPRDYCGTEVIWQSHTAARCGGSMKVLSVSINFRRVQFLSARVSCSSRPSQSSFFCERMQNFADGWTNVIVTERVAEGHAREKPQASAANFFLYTKTCQPAETKALTSSVRHRCKRLLVFIACDAWDELQKNDSPKVYL